MLDNAASVDLQGCYLFLRLLEYNIVGFRST